MQTPWGKLIDIAEMPGFNAKATSRGDHSVSQGHIYWHDRNLVSCHHHGAMLAVNPERTIWRCIACGAGAYLLRNP